MNISGIYVHTYYSPPRRRGNRTLRGVGANEYTLSPEPRYAHLFEKTETWTLAEFRLRFPDAGGLDRVMQGVALPYVYY